MRIVFIGCVDFSHAALAHVRTLPEAEVVGVVTRSASPANADFHSLAEQAQLISCPLLFADTRDDARLAHFIRGVRADLVYCVGWSQLLGREVLSAASKGVIGYHPAALPENRGRHPIIWALALGLERTASTFFCMDEGADSGDIVSQEQVAIAPDDNAATLYARLQTTALQQLTHLTTALATGRERRIPQDDVRANTWRKRGPADGAIDWRMSAESIRNLVRALTHPYVGAHCMFSGREVKIWRVERGQPASSNIEPGKVLSVRDGVVEVKCGDASIRVLEHQFDELPAEHTYL